MSRRRPHWTDDLIEAVRYVYNLQMHHADDQEELDSICDVIEVIEDWERERLRDAFVPVTTGDARTDQMLRIQALKDADTVFRMLGGE